jgi:AcrR family transcriptional regulator
MNESSTSRPRPGEGTREQLLVAARRCVRDHGLAGATSRQITAAAGANLAAITYHFGSKDELIAEALFAELERRVRPALDLLDQPADPSGGEVAGDATARLLPAVQALLEEFERSRADTVVYLEALLLATRDARYRRSALALYRSLRTRLAELIIELTAAGVVPPWVEAEAMASLILSVANGISLQTCLDVRGPDQTAMATQFAGLLLAAAYPERA